jgi:hypothetical protein
MSPSKNRKTSLPTGADRDATAASSEASQSTHHTDVFESYNKKSGNAPPEVDGSGLTVIGNAFDFELDKGQSIKQVIRLVNDSCNDTVVLSEFVNEDTGSFQSYLPFFEIEISTDGADPVRIIPSQETALEVSISSEGVSRLKDFMLARHREPTSGMIRVRVSNLKIQTSVLLHDREVKTTLILVPVFVSCAVKAYHQKGTTTRDFHDRIQPAVFSFSCAFKNFVEMDLLSAGEGSKCFTEGCANMAAMYFNETSEDGIGHDSACCLDCYCDRCTEEGYWYDRTSDFDGLSDEHLQLMKEKCSSGRYTAPFGFSLSSIGDENGKGKQIVFGCFPSSTYCAVSLFVLENLSLTSFLRFGGGPGAWLQPKHVSRPPAITASMLTPEPVPRSSAQTFRALMRVCRLLHHRLRSLRRARKCFLVMVRTMTTFRTNSGSRRLLRLLCLQEMAAETC